jgi:recombination protein RecR
MLPKSVQNLIDEFSRLPGIGPKTAARLTFYMLSKGENDIENFGNSVINLKKNLVFCQECYNITENKEKCQICSDIQRDQTSVCIVEEPLDTVAVEKTDYRGKYHVLGGVISPIDGIGPENIRIRELVEKLANHTEIKEIILATDPSLEGEATAMYILELVKKNQKDGKINKDLRITRIARGLPIGGDLEYADEVTLSRALEGRREYL